MCAPVKGHAPCGMGHVQHKSITCGSVYTFMCQTTNTHVTAAEIFNVRRINKRAFFALLYSNRDFRAIDFSSKHEMTLKNEHILMSLGRGKPVSLRPATLRCLCGQCLGY